MRKKLEKRRRKKDLLIRILLRDVGGGNDGMRLFGFCVCVCVAFFVTRQDSTAQKSGAIKVRERERKGRLSGSLCV